MKIASSAYTRAVLGSDGVVRCWGSYSPTLSVPMPPLGMHYVDISMGDLHAYAKRSDGTWISWGSNSLGQCNTPAPPVGSGWGRIVAGNMCSAGLLTNGNIVVWGDVSSGQAATQALPNGLQYVDVAVGLYHVVAKRSDGSLVAWGDNTFGQCNLPPLPSGLSYTSFSAGRPHTVALRSDGVVITAGHRGFDGPTFAVPPGQTLRVLETGGWHALGITSGGDLVAAGAYQVGQCSVPSLPPGVVWTNCAAGAYFSCGLGSDGLVRAFGLNTVGQCNVPTLPAGLFYTDVACGFSHAVALRSDGMAVTWGNTAAGSVSVPPLPPGLTYRSVGAGTDSVLLIRSDGSLVVGAAVAGSIPPAPALPPGVEYVQAEGGASIVVALRSDGEVVAWDQWSPDAWPYVLPRGQSYVEVACSRLWPSARRSDGTIVGGWPAPPLSHGACFHSIESGWDYLTVASVGSRSTYLGVSAGCGANDQVARIVPSDTPKLGRTLTLRLGHMPVNAGWMAFGWSRLPGIDLTSLGMTDCWWYVSPDVVVSVVGVNGWGRLDVAIPSVVTLLGATWHNQAIMFDPSANSVGLVVSEAAEGVIGG